MIFVDRTKLALASGHRYSRFHATPLPQGPTCTTAGTLHPVRGTTGVPISRQQQARKRPNQLALTTSKHPT
jgi:hypothetical protein